MDIKDLFIPLRLGAGLALELAKLRVHVIGSGRYKPLGLGRPHKHSVGFHGGTTAVFDLKTDRAAIETGDIYGTGGLRGPSRDLTVPEEFAAFMTDLDGEILKALPEFPTSGFALADNIGHYLNIVNRPHVEKLGGGYRYPYQDLLKDDEVYLPLKRRPWALGPETAAFLEAAQGTTSKLYHREEFEAGKPAFSTIKDPDLAADIRWYNQVDDWTGNGLENRQKWMAEGFFWQKLETTPSLIAFEASIMRNGGQPVRGERPPTTGRRLDEGKDYYVLTLAGDVVANIFADVDPATGEIEAWAVPYWIEGMFEKDMPRMLDFLENRILPGTAKTYG